jgi:hypothetical protein
LELRKYPASLAYYAATLGAMNGNRWPLFRELTKLTIGSGREKTNALTQLTAASVFSNEVAAFSESTKWYFPLSEHLRRAIFPAVPGGDSDRSDHFDRLEVLLALAFLDIAMVGDTKPIYMPYGRFAAHHDDAAYAAVFEEFERDGESWGPIEAGMFAGSVTRFEQVRDIFIELMKTNSTRWW